MRQLKGFLAMMTDVPCFKSDQLIVSLKSEEERCLVFVVVVVAVDVCLRNADPGSSLTLAEALTPDVAVVAL